MPLTTEDVQERIGNLLMTIWQLRQELAETQVAYEQAKLRIAELEKPREAE